MQKIIIILILIVSTSARSQKIELIESFIGYTQKSEIISFTPNPQLIMSGDYSGGLNLWDLKKQKLIKKIKAHQHSINNITFHSKKNIFLTCSNDSTIKLWSLHSNRMLDSLKIQDIPTLTFFQENNNTYFICTKNGLILEKKTRSNQVKTITNINNFINDAILTVDEKHIITCDNESIKIICAPV